MLQAAAQPIPDTPPIPRKSGWSPERRAKHAAAIRKWKPWVKSTGPRTVSGKARASLNAYKHGQYALQMRLMNEALWAQSRFVRLCNIYMRLKRQKVENELLARLWPQMRLLNRTFNVRLYQALRTPDYAKILLFRRP